MSGLLATRGDFRNLLSFHQYSQHSQHSQISLRQHSQYSQPNLKARWGEVVPTSRHFAADKGVATFCEL